MIGGPSSFWAKFLQRLIARHGDSPPHIDDREYDSPWFLMMHRGKALLSRAQAGFLRALLSLPVVPRLPLICMGPITSTRSSRPSFFSPRLQIVLYSHFETEGPSLFPDPPTKRNRLPWHGLTSLWWSRKSVSDGLGLSVDFLDFLIIPTLTSKMIHSHRY